MNQVTYKNRYKDDIIFTHEGDTVTMEGGKWFRYGLSNDYSVAYAAYINDGGTESKEEFEKLVHEYDNEAKSYTEFAKKYQPMVFSSNEICMVDPSGGPYIALGNNLNSFWPKREYQDLIVHSISFDSSKEDSIVTFKIK
jgi:hypothetical protein